MKTKFAKGQQMSFAQAEYASKKEANRRDKFVICSKTTNCRKRCSKEANALLIELGLLMSRGTLIDATLIAAPSSTKNKKRERDPEMHQTKKATSGTLA